MKVKTKNPECIVINHVNPQGSNLLMTTYKGKKIYQLPSGRFTFNGCEKKYYKLGNLKKYIDNGRLTRNKKIKDNNKTISEFEFYLQTKII